MRMPDVYRTEFVPAHPESVWELVSDLPRMGELSPEATGGRWVQGDGPVVGAVFKGTNAQGKRSWSSKATVTRATRGRCFEIRARVFGMAVADWAYDLEEVAGGTQVTQSWKDRRGSCSSAPGRS